MQPKNMGELQPTGRSKLFTHYDNLALGNISTRAAGIHDDISTPGGCWASRGGGGASNVDAPGSNFKLYRERTSSLALEGMMLKSSPIFFALARTPGNKGPRTSGLLLRFACWLFTGDLCGCVAVLAVDCALCTAILMRYPDVAALTSRTRWTAALTSRTRRIVAVRAFDLLFDFQRSTFIFW